jgi:hypothetical protein
VAAGLAERVPIIEPVDAAVVEAPEPPTPASTTESLGDSGNEFSPEKSPAPGAASPCVCLLYNADSPLLTGYRAVYTYFPCATGGQLYTRRDVRIPSSLLDSDSDDAAPTKKQKYN